MIQLIAAWFKSDQGFVITITALLAIVVVLAAWLAIRKQDGY